MPLLITYCAGEDKPVPLIVKDPSSANGRFDFTARRVFLEVASAPGQPIDYVLDSYTGTPKIVITDAVQGEITATFDQPNTNALAAGFFVWTLRSDLTAGGGRRCLAQYEPLRVDASDAWPA